MNSSPWIDQLELRHNSTPLSENKHTDIVIVGGGIAGISTAYYLLADTKRNIILVEGDRVGHGASGHNGGQIVSYFEKQISGLVSEYGLNLTARAQKDIHSGWDLLRTIINTTKLDLPVSIFTGFCGCQDLAEVIVHLENNLYSFHTKNPIEPMLIAQESEIVNQIPDKLRGQYRLVPHEEVMGLLETHDESYIAVISAQKGCMNSAQFCEELLKYLLINYPDRFSVYEHSHVSEVRLYESNAKVCIRDFVIQSNKVVLCTNGYEKFKITNQFGPDIDTKFHQLIKGSVGYMLAYTEDRKRRPIAISYLSNSSAAKSAYEAPPYYYLSRRDWDNKQSLLVLGGPEALMDDTNNYEKGHPYPKEAKNMGNEFLNKSYKFTPEFVDYKYTWHGVMGYTPNGLRCIGPEPVNPVLMYNLGCNGVGLLPSIFGGNKIARFINGELLEKSLFDPHDNRINAEK